MKSQLDKCAVILFRKLPCEIHVFVIFLTEANIFVGGLGAIFILSYLISVYLLKANMLEYTTKGKNQCIYANNML